MKLPKTWLPYLKFLPGSPAKLRIHKALIKGTMTDWMADFMDELKRETMTMTGSVSLTSFT